MVEAREVEFIFYYSLHHPLLSTLLIVRDSCYILYYYLYTCKSWVFFYLIGRMYCLTLLEINKIDLETN